MSSKKGQKQAGQNMKSTVGSKRQGLGVKDRSQSPPSTTEKKAKFSEKSLADAKISEKTQRHTPLIDDDGYETIESSKNKKSDQDRSLV
jgi:hypothetical protein